MTARDEARTLISECENDPVPVNAAYAARLLRALVEEADELERVRATAVELAAVRGVALEEARAELERVRENIAETDELPEEYLREIFAGPPCETCGGRLADEAGVRLWQQRDAALAEAARLRTVLKETR